MPRQVTVLRVMVSSPSGLDDERDCLNDVIDELNGLMGADSAIRLEPINWGRDITPGVGSEPQDVVNRQIDDCDVFIGLLWTRFGTPTSRFGSGTEEEFQQALSRFRKDERAVRILFYFKISSPSVLGDINLIEMGKVREFQERLSSEGVLYGTFHDRNDLFSLLLQHLGRVMREWNDTKNTAPVDPIRLEGRHATTASPITTTEIEDDDDGFIDLVEQADDCFTSGNVIIEGMTSDLQNLGTEMEELTGEITLTMSSAENVSIGQLKRMNNRAADLIDRYAAKTEPLVPRMSSAYTDAINATIKSIGMLRDMDRESNNVKIDNVVDSMIDAREAMKESHRQLIEFRSVLAGLPRITSKFVRAKRRVLRVMDALLDELSKLINLFEQFGDFGQNT